MVFYILISIVFTAELIIAFTLMSCLLKWDKVFNDTDLFLKEAKPKIRDIMQIGRNISEQLVELVPMWVDNVKETLIKIAVQNMKNMLTGFGIWAIRYYLKKHHKLGL